MLGRLIWECEDEQSVTQVIWLKQKQIIYIIVITLLRPVCVLQGSRKSFSYQTEDEYSEEVSRSKYVQFLL